MVTNYCYKDIDPKWDDVVGPKSGRKINECCGKPDPDDPTGGDCCYDTWQVQLKQVSQSYKAATEKSDQIKKRLVFITDRRDRYRTWVTELDKTEEKARQICHQLEIIATQSRKIWYNTCKAVQAIEILYCMVTDFFFQVDALRKKYDDLMTCVNNNHDPAIGKGTGILVYADDYLKKLEAVIKTRDDLVKPVLEAIRIANLIRNNISTRECPLPTPDPKPSGYEGYDPCNPKDEICPDCCDDKSRYYGFKAIICEWYKEFNCKVECEDPDPCLTEQQKQDRDRRMEQEAQKAAELRKANCNESQEPAPPSDDCKLKPMFCFPICNDGYKIKIDGWLKADESKVKVLAGDLKDSQKEKESLQACKDSLTKAVAEVNPKDRCK